MARVVLMGGVPVIQPARAAVRRIARGNTMKHAASQPRLARIVHVLAAGLALSAPLTAAAGTAGEVSASGRPTTLSESLRFSIGLVGLMSSVPEHRDWDDFVGFGGLRAGYTIDGHLTVGLTDLAIGSDEQLGGTRHMIGGGPYAEYGTFVFHRVQAFGQLGAPLQLRYDGGQDESVGLAPFGALGLRWWMADVLALGVEGRAQFVVTDGYLAGGRLLPQGAAPISGGLALDFHF